METGAELGTQSDRGNAVCKHWSEENQPHLCLDVIFGEDASRARNDNSPLNLNVLRKQVLVLLNAYKYGRWSKGKMMFKAILNPDVLPNILFSPMRKCCRHE